MLGLVLFPCDFFNVSYTCKWICLILSMNFLAFNASPCGVFPLLLTIHIQHLRAKVENIQSKFQKGLTGRSMDYYVTIILNINQIFIPGPFYKASINPDTFEQCKLADLFPQMVNEEDSRSLYRPVTIEELKSVLFHFKKEKSPGPDGWTIEFFIFFFDLVGEDLLAFVEDSRRLGTIYGGINATFLTLIPKANKPASFDDFRPISLCNLCYKIISKLIANRLITILSEKISTEQLGFLKGRHIQDAIGTAHEFLHSIKKYKLKALVLKLDLKKAYDCIDWDFLRLILHKIGLEPQMTKWILTCVTSSSFAVLINGEASDFFRSGRGVRQGCPLSPLLFVLAMEGLSLLLKQNFVDGHLSGIKISRLSRILHLIFADDVLILSKASLSEWQVINTLITHFCNASGLTVNPQKSTIHHEGISETDLSSYKNFLPYTFSKLSSGFRYLGYFLKTGTQRAADWNWLVIRMEKKLNLWTNRWLSLGGHFILLKSVLEGQNVYWMSLETLPRLILNKLRILMFHFLWTGHQEAHQYHLCKWEILSRPKKQGGWGLHKLPLFNLALITTNLWRVLTHHSIWQQVIFDKYLHNSSIIDWIRHHSHKQVSASKFWTSLRRTLPIINHWAS
jgi:hypothetical protein